MGGSSCGCTPQKKCSSCNEKKVCKKEEPKSCFPEKKCCENKPPFQIDARQVIYRKDSKECGSFLEDLGITNGTDLEYIVDTFGKMLREFTYFNVQDNMYGAENFEEFMQALQEDIKGYKSTLRVLQDSIQEKDEKIEELKLKVAELEVPGLVDTQGLGFTVDSSLQDILQKIIDNE